MPTHPAWRQTLAAILEAGKQPSHVVEGDNEYLQALIESEPSVRRMKVQTSHFAHPQVSAQCEVSVAVVNTTAVAARARRVQISYMHARMHALA